MLLIQSQIKHKSIQQNSHHVTLAIKDHIQTSENKLAWTSSVNIIRFNLKILGHFIRDFDILASLDKCQLLE